MVADYLLQGCDVEVPEEDLEEAPLADDLKLVQLRCEQLALSAAAASGPVPPNLLILSKRATAAHQARVAKQAEKLQSILPRDAPAAAQVDSVAFLQEVVRLSVKQVIVSILMLHAPVRPSAMH